MNVQSSPLEGCFSGSLLKVNVFSELVENQIFKGPLLSFFREEIQTMINEVVIQKAEIFTFSINWINLLFSEENKVPRTLCEAGTVAGSATYKQIFEI